MKAGTVIAVVGGTLVVLGGGAYLLLRKGPDSRSACDKLAAGAALGFGAAKGVAIQPGIAQAAGSLACDLIEPLADVIGKGLRNLPNLLEYLPPVLLAKGIIKVGEAAVDLGRDVATTVGDIVGSTVSGIGGAGRTVGKIGGRTVNVAEDVIGAGVHTGQKVLGAVGSGIGSAVSFVNPFD